MAVRTIPTSTAAQQDRPVTTATAAHRRSLFALTRDRALVIAWASAACVAFIQAVKLIAWGHFGDAQIYWAVWAHSPMYGAAPGTPGAWIYPPIVADVLWPFTLLPWPVFLGLWTTGAATSYLWLVRPLRWVWAVPLLTLTLEDIRAGNCLWLLSLSCVLGVRRASWWLLPALVKIGPGVGVLWFAARREWRPLAVTAGIGSVAVAVSVAVHPGLWVEWFDLMRANGSPGVAVRIVAAGALAWWAGRTDRAWWLPVALLLASPVLGFWPLALLCAIPRLLPTHAVEWANAPLGGLRATLWRALDLSVVEDEATSRQPEDGL